MTHFIGGTSRTSETTHVVNNPATGETVSMRRGPYGFYIQLGEPGTDAKGAPTCATVKVDWAVKGRAR